MLPFSVSPLLPGTSLCWKKSVNTGESSQIHGEPTAHAHVGETEAGKALLCPLTFSFPHSHQQSCLCQFLSTRLQACMESSLKSISLGSQVLSQILAKLFPQHVHKHCSRVEKQTTSSLTQRFPESLHILPHSEPCFRFWWMVPSKISYMPAILKINLEMKEFPV